MKSSSVLDSIKNKTPDAPSTMLLTNSGKQVNAGGDETRPTSATATFEQEKMTGRFNDANVGKKHEDFDLEHAYRENTNHDHTALQRQAQAIAMTREHSKYINAEVKPDL